MTATSSRAVRRFLGFVCLILVATSVLGLLGIPPTRRWAPEAGLASMWAGLVVCVVASIAGGLPVLMAEARRGTMRPQDLLGSLAVRFLVVLVGIAYVLFSGLATTAPFLVWTGIGYLFLLPIDVWYSLKGRNPTVAESDSPSRARDAR